jgi:hypothetical protein
MLFVFSPILQARIVMWGKPKFQFPWDGTLTPLTCRMVPAASCRFRHVKNTHDVVCKHWLNNRCTNGDDCKFLHRFYPRLMPECTHFKEGRWLDGLPPLLFPSSAKRYLCQLGPAVGSSKEALLVMVGLVPIGKPSHYVRFTGVGGPPRSIFC